MKINYHTSTDCTIKHVLFQLFNEGCHQKTKYCSWKPLSPSAEKNLRVTKTPGQLAECLVLYMSGKI